MTETNARALFSNRIAGSWMLDSAATTVKISHKTMWGLLPVRGAFTGVAGEGALSTDGGLLGTLRIAAGSIDTGKRKRDDRMRSEDFLDVERHPFITVRITSAEVIRSDLVLSADLEVTGIHEPIQLGAQVTTVSAGRVMVGVDTTIDSGRFGLSWNRFGMATGPTKVSVTAVFNRTAIDVPGMM
jgi:polyisoprenoid-binding protein YceI